MVLKERAERWMEGGTIWRQCDFRFALLLLSLASIRVMRI